MEHISPRVYRQGMHSIPRAHREGAVRFKCTDNYIPTDIPRLRGCEVIESRERIQESGWA